MNKIVVTIPTIGRNPRDRRITLTRDSRFAGIARDRWHRVWICKFVNGKSSLWLCFGSTVHLHAKEVR